MDEDPGTLMNKDHKKDRADEELDGIEIYETKREEEREEEGGGGKKKKREKRRNAPICEGGTQGVIHYSITLGH